MPFTNYTSRVLTAYMFGCNSFTPPEILYIALSTTEPNYLPDESNNWNFTEPESYSYERVPVENIPGNWLEAADQNTLGYIQQNNTVITFPKATGPWGKITTFGIFDDPHNGMLLGYGNLETPQTITNGDMASFPVGSLTITLL